MSIPPQLIRVKRKRVEEAPVTFLQFDEQCQKRHRCGSNWAYQRRSPAPLPPPNTAVCNDRPVIHVSRRQNADASPPTKNRRRSSSLHPAASPTSAQKHDAKKSALAEPRRFHVSRSTLPAGKSPTPSAGISARDRYAPAVFIERRRRHHKATGIRKSLAALQAATQPETEPPKPSDALPATTVEQKQLKRPGGAGRKTRGPHKDVLTHAPLPASLMNYDSQDMDKITAAMNQWVLDEIGANLEKMVQEKHKVETAKFRPKVPAQRYQSRHPEQVPALQPAEPMDVVMIDASEEDVNDEDWVMDEYVRIPANSVASDVLPSDIGLLVLEDDEESRLFFGPAQDEDDNLAEDDEDENAENHYTADYPEDEVESDDEYGRHPYGYRNGLASDDEEFDVYYSDEADDDKLAVADGIDDDEGEDARMARIRIYMQRNSAFSI